MIIPKGMLERVEKIEVLYACAHRHQLANCAQLRDHEPLYVQVKYRVWFDGGAEQRKHGLNVTKMMHSWTKGLGLEGYKETAEEWAQRLVLDPRWLSAVENDDTDAMMRQLSKGIEEVACVHFSKALVKGKYNRSERTEALYEKKTISASNGTADEGADCFARVRYSEAGNVWGGYSVLTKNLENHVVLIGVRGQQDGLRRCIQRDGKGDWCEIWRLARRIAGTGLGTKRRTYADAAAQRNRHSSRNGETRGDGTPRPRRGADGEQSGKDQPSQSRLRTMGSQRGLSWMQIPGT